MLQDVRHKVLLLQELEHLEAGELIAVPILIGRKHEKEQSLNQRLHVKNIFI